MDVASKCLIELLMSPKLYLNDIFSSLKKKGNLFSYNFMSQLLENSLLHFVAWCRNVNIKDISNGRSSVLWLMLLFYVHFKSSRWIRVEHVIYLSYSPLEILYIKQFLFYANNLSFIWEIFKPNIRLSEMYLELSY